MKKYLKFFSLLVFVCVCFVNIGLFSVENKVSRSFSLNNLFITANADIECHLSDGYCTCNNGVCQDGNWIGFRRTCGTGDSDFACSGHSGC